MTHRFRPYVELSQSDTPKSISSLSDCLTDISLWMKSSRPKLKLNSDKTEFIIIGTKQQRHKLSNHFPVQLLDNDRPGPICPSDSVRNLGVVFDSDFSFHKHVSNNMQLMLLLSYSAAVIDGIKRNSRIYVGDSIVRKTDTRLSKEEDVVVCLPGARIEHVTERVEKIMGRGKGGTILVHIGTNNADKEGTTAIVDKYRKLLKKTKEARVEQIILSGILPVFGNRLDGYRNAKRMAINGMVKRLCMEEDVGYVDLWDSLVGKEEMYARDGLHLSGKGAAVFAEGLSGAVASGLGKVRYLN